MNEVFGDADGDMQ